MNHSHNARAARRATTETDELVNIVGGITRGAQAWRWRWVRYMTVTQRGKRDTPPRCSTSSSRRGAPSPPRRRRPHSIVVYIISIGRQSYTRNTRTHTRAHAKLRAATPFARDSAAQRRVLNGNGNEITFPRRGAVRARSQNQHVRGTTRRLLRVGIRR